MDSIKHTKAFPPVTKIRNQKLNLSNIALIWNLLLEIYKTVGRVIRLYMIIGTAQARLSSLVLQYYTLNAIHV